jgi:putative tricarboxylic transport membrane protein
MEEGQDKSAVSLKTMEIAVAGLFLAFGLVVSWDSYRLGARWGSDGPQAGYFPFYIGLIIIVCSLITLGQAFFMRAAANTPFVLRGQLKMVTLVMVPTIIYVGLIHWLGIYVASAIYIAMFMWWLGKYAWTTIVPVSLGVNVASFLMFEIWFKVPLPKGPLEAALGLN